MSNLERFRNTFREEASELLNNLEHYLLQLEENPGNEADVAAVFRAMHTIKGSAAMFGFQHISRFTHEVETVFDHVRSGHLAVSKDLITITLSARDHILEMLNFDEEIPAEAIKDSERILADLQTIEAGKVLPQDRPPHPHALLTPGDDPAKRNPGTGGSRQTFRIRFVPKPEIMKNGTRPLALLKELRDLGECTVLPWLKDIPPLESLEPEACHVRWDIMLTGETDTNAIRDVFLFVEGMAEIDVTLVDIPDVEAPATPRIGEILVSRGAVSPEVVQDIVERQPRIGDMLKEVGVSEQELNSALEEQRHIRSTRQKQASEPANQSIRVNSQKLDGLVDLVGELVTLQARLSQTARDVRDATVQHLAESLERLTAELRDTTMGMRMLPMGTTFMRFKRLVRDLAGELGKEADLETAGGETELDKTVLERLQDPLVHLIRNSVDHGIEVASVRTSQGKPAAGVVSLSAEHAGSTVLIKVQDDGKGIDSQAIYRRAVDRGIIGKGQILSEQESFDLIFQPGFSTAEKVSSVSGRGVGLDVVKKEIENLNGSVHVSSSPGKGTLFTLEIPLTLAIIEGLLVRIGLESYVIPLSLIEECLEYRGQLLGAESTTIPNRGEMLPILSLRTVLEINDSPEPEIQQIVVVNHQGHKLGMLVDTVIGDHQTVIKNLGKMYRNNIGMSGATILGDGTVALILDILGLVDYFENRARHAETRKVASA